MIQILGLRTFIPPGSEIPKKFDAFFDENWRADSIYDLFKNIDTHLAKIPKKDQWNIFYTAANCAAGKREFSSLDAIVFDIDKINVAELDAYIPVICKVLGINESETGIVFSGHGLHVIVGLKKPLTDKKIFKELKPHYADVCRKLEKALETAGLPGDLDTTVFEARRIMRLPNTINRKEAKPDVMARVINGNLMPIDFTLERLSTLEKIAAKDQINAKVLAKYPRTDNKAILEECGFLKHVAKNPNDIDEPQWYAALSVAARMENGNSVCHEISKGYRGYKHAETEEKITQAIEASGPRTCDNINSIYGKCASCPHYGKVNSPILIRGKEHIRTEFTGFHDIVFKGADPKYIPNPVDLLKFYKREHNFKVLTPAKICYVWNGTHYVDSVLTEIQNFAYLHYDPVPNMKTVCEFSGRVMINELRKIEWFEDNTHKKMNFQNGYLDIQTLEFRPATPDMGFRHVLPYQYEAAATCPIFDNMLRRVTAGNESLQKALLEFMGYALSNDRYWLHSALVLVGEGSNGKSTFVRVLEDLAGNENTSGLKMSEMKSEYNRQQLDGKLFNISGETPTKALEDASYFKSLVSGDTISARRIYDKPYSFKNKAKLIFTCNELPTAHDHSHGFYRRLLIAPFDVKFSTEDPDFDPHIEEKLKAELPGIFNRALEGYHRLLKNKCFTDVDVANKRKEAYRLSSDSVARWASESLIMHMNGQADKHFIGSDDLFRAFAYDMDKEKEKPITKENFILRLRRVHPWLAEKATTKRINGKKTRGYCGIQLANDAEYTENPSNYEAVHC